jgi:hypothetical protein
MLLLCVSIFVPMELGELPPCDESSLCAEQIVLGS